MVVLIWAQIGEVLPNIVTTSMCQPSGKDKGTIMIRTSILSLTILSASAVPASSSMVIRFKCRAPE